MTTNTYRGTAVDIIIENFTTEVETATDDNTATNANEGTLIKGTKKNYTINPPRPDEDTPIKFNHVDIFITNDTLEISGLFECKKIETAYRRFRKVMTQAATDNPQLEGWDNFLPAEKLTQNVNGWENENGDQIFFTNAIESLCVDINEDIFYIFGKFNIYAAEVNTATDTNEEIINCTDDIIITDDAYTQMIRGELANAQIASGNYDIRINGEWVYFTNHKITRIDAELKLGFSFEYTPQGRKQFRHLGRVVSRDSVSKLLENTYINDVDWVKLFASLGTDPNADNFFEARFITSVSFSPKNQTMPLDIVAIRSTDFNRAEKAKEIIKNTLATMDVDIFEDLRIDFMPRCIGVEEPVEVYYFNETDGSEEDDFADELPALIPAEDTDDDDELIDPPTITPADDFEAKLAELKAKQDAAKTAELAAKKVYKEAGDKYEECREATQNFLDAHADMLTQKIRTIEIKQYIEVVNAEGRNYYDVRNTGRLYVYAFNAFGKMFLVRYLGNELGIYDTPAQVETVINMLKAAVERGDTEFKFPTVEELAISEVDKTATADSLTRAMTTALEHYQDFCRVKNLTGAEYELKLYNICRKAMSELWKEEAA